jgi:putative transposase
VPEEKPWRAYFYSYSAEHWKYIQKFNPIKSTFATFQLKTKKVKNIFSSQTVVTMVFQLCRCAEKRWQKINVGEKLAKIIEGVQFVTGVKGSPPKPLIIKWQ